MDRTQLIDWSSSETQILLNPRLPPELKNRVKPEMLPTILGHVWIGSSGTTSTGSMTLYGLKKTGILIAGEAANRHLETTNKDIWILTLPVFHVGGLSIWARAHLGGQTVVDRSLDSWGAAKFHSWVEESRATLAALVPTQVFDLVKLGRKAPSSLRAIVIGGAALSEELYFQARELGFPVLPSFGATEACSQIATAELSSLTGDAYPELRVLSHIEVKLIDGDRLAIRSAALFTVRVEITANATDILWRAGEWYVMKDLTELSFDENDPGRIWLTPRGRVGELVKISGELVNVLDLTKLFFNVSSGADFAMLPVSNERRGHEIVLVMNIRHYSEHALWVNEFNSQVIPVAKIQSVYFVRELPKSELGKIHIGQLKKDLGLQ